MNQEVWKCTQSLSEKDVNVKDWYFQTLISRDIPADLDEWVRKCDTKILHGNHRLLGLVYFFIREKVITLS